MGNAYIRIILYANDMRLKTVTLIDMQQLFIYKNDTELVDVITCIFNPMKSILILLIFAPQTIYDFA